MNQKCSIYQLKYKAQLQQDSQESESKSYFKHFSNDFKDNQHERSLLTSNQKNYALLVLLLSIVKKSNIVQYRSIQLSNENKLIIEMERGHSYNVQSRWFGSIDRKQIPIIQKYKFIRDVCKGLINLTELKILNLDIHHRNIIKIKNKFKIIDFDCAFLIEETQTGPEYRNYLRGSQVQAVKRQLFKTFKEILGKTLNFYQKNYMAQKNIFLFLRQYPNYENIHLGSQNMEQNIKLLVSNLQNDIKHIHSRQFAGLIKYLFSQQQIQSIQSCMNFKSKLKRKKLEQIIKLLETPHLYSLKQFYFEFNNQEINDLATKELNQDFNDNHLIKQIHNKKVEQFWKDVLTKQNTSCLLQSFQKNNHYCQLSSSSVQEEIKKSVNEIIINHSYIKSHICGKSIVKMNQFKYSPHLLFSQPQLILSQEQSSFFANSEINNLGKKFINRRNIFCFQQLQKRSQQIISKNMAQNYFVFQVLLADKITKKIISDYLLTPINFHSNSSDLSLKLQYPRPKDQILNNHNNRLEMIEQIWSKGFNSVIKFIKDIAQAIICLQELGLFHPQITIENIIVMQQEKKQLFKLKSLQKCYFLSSHYILENEDQRLLNANKMLFYYLLNSDIKKYSTNFTHLSNNLQEFIDQIQETSFFQSQEHKSSFGSLDQISSNKITLMFQYLRQQFKKIHSRQLGQILKDLFSFYKEKNHLKLAHYSQQNISLLSFCQQKMYKLKKLIMQLLDSNMKNRITVSSFYSQINQLFPTCDVTDHHDEAVLYYFIDQQKKECLCNKCIQVFPKQNINLYCLDHHRPIRYLNSDNRNKHHNKLYYCEKCCDILPSNHPVQLIDPTDLLPCQFVCMNLQCQQYLVSLKNRQKNHHNHNTINFKQLVRFYKEINTQNSNQTVDFCRQSGNASISHLLKITSCYTQRISQLFKEITQFKMQGTHEFERLNKIINPTYQGRFHKRQENNQSFWKVLNIMYFIYQKSNEKQFKMVSVEGYVQYCSSRFQELANEANQNIKKILSQLCSKFQSQIFSTEIHKKILRFIEQKYGQVINNQKQSLIKPTYFSDLSDKYNQAVKKLQISKQQIYLGQYFMFRNQRRCQFTNFCQRRCNIYQKWIESVKLKNEDLYFINNKEKKKKILQSRKSQFIQQSNLPEKILQSIVQQKSLIQKIIKQNKEKDYQSLNLAALDRKKQNLENQQLFIGEIRKNLQQINKLHKRLNYIQDHSFANKQIQQLRGSLDKIIGQLNETIEINSSQLRAFNIQLMYNIPNFSKTDTDKINSFTNLQQLSIVQHQNPIFMKTFDRQYTLTIQMLQGLILSCNKLAKLSIKGGYAQVLPCLTHLLQHKNTPNFILYLNSETFISKKDQFQKLHNHLRAAKFTFPCLSIRLRSNIDAQQKQMIIDILSKIRELKLEVYGPLKTNKFTIQILNHVISRKDLKVTSLLLRRLNLKKCRNIFKEIAKKGKIEKLVLINCIEYDPQLLDQCRQHLKNIIIRGSLENRVSAQFMSSLLLCRGLRGIELNNIMFDPLKSSLKELPQLKWIIFQFCPQIDDGFLIFHKNVIQKIEYVILRECVKITDVFMDELRKMSNLKYLNLSNNKIAVQKLLSLETASLQVLHIRQYRVINDLFLYKIGEKWPYIIDIAIPKFSSVTAQTVKKCFKRLKNIVIFKQQFSKQEKAALMSNSINIQQYN